MLVAREVKNTYINMIRAHHYTKTKKIAHTTTNPTKNTTMHHTRDIQDILTHPCNNTTNKRVHFGAINIQNKNTTNLTTSLTRINMNMCGGSGQQKAPTENSTELPGMGMVQCTHGMLEKNSAIPWSKKAHSHITSNTIKFI